MKMSQTPPRDQDQGDPKKIYNECLIQYYSAANAKKRLNDQRSVFDNRFISLKQSYVNIIPPSEVPPPSQEILDSDAAILQSGPQQSRGGAGAAGPPVRSKPFQQDQYQPRQPSMYHQGQSNKYRRTAEDDNRVHVDTHTDMAALGLDANGDFPSVANMAETAALSYADVLKDRSSASAAPVVAAPTLTVPYYDKSQSKEALESLKSLRQQADDISKRKEAILVVSLHIFLNFFLQP
jgi:hypothetical protein